MIYDRADKAIKEMNRRNLKAFNQLKLAKWDELNVIRKVNGVYDDSIRMAKRRYYEIAVEAYIVAMIEAKKTNREATRMADESITNDWILDMLEEVDPVTLYAFLPEAERKKARLIEAATVAADNGREIDRALRYWTVQIAQYADNSVYRARLQAFRDAGIRRVKWVTQKDARVCEDCDELDEQIFLLEEVPPPQHIHCRCVTVPVIE